MDSAANSSTDHRPASVAAQSQPPDARLHAISSLLKDIDEAAGTPQAQATLHHENKLIQVRLGVASGLFAALQVKHPASAAHSLRVALGCSAWGLAMDISDLQRDQIEAAALLHDVGKIGVPDHVLLKPAALDAEEAALMRRQRHHGVYILSSCVVTPEMLDIVRYASVWYAGDGRSVEHSGPDLPLGARMLAIVDAFDSMTTEHVWRRAMSRERAMAELFEHSGTQFDPELVKQYCALQSGDQARLQARVARRWLQQLEIAQSNGLWQLNDDFPQAGVAPSIGAQDMFSQMLVENMNDAVIFVDSNLRIDLWNHAAERLTGIAADAVMGKHWLPRIIEMLNERGLVIADEECPVAHAMRNGTQEFRRAGITGRKGKEVQVNVHIMPVIAENGSTRGAAILLHDVSSETNLEEQVQSLSERANRDALTKVANRAEFDRSLVRFIVSHLARELPCALILCDIDHFKKINDTYGHQAGDEALVTFAGLLKRSCRTGDVVARYGGEEFALLCAECDNATATARAEKLRREIATVQHESLGGQSFTSSFGVTEVQQGDTPETMLRRADRALYEAKEMGRNMVVQLGAGLSGREEEPQITWWQSWFGGGKVDQLLEARLVTSVPIKMVVEKLRGFVADQEAEITAIEESQVVLTIDGPAIPLLRRSTDRVVPFTVELEFDEQPGKGNNVKTLINVVIRPKRGRDRRKRDSVQRARQVLTSLKSYLMAHDYLEHDELASVVLSPDEHKAGVLRQAKFLLAPWLESAPPKN